MTGEQPRHIARRILRWSTIVLAGLLALVLLLALLGAGYERIAEAGDAQRYPPPGQLVDIGGYRLHIHCIGTGSPTVILDAGLGGSSLDWSLVQPALAATTRICAYDRAGMGWSDPGPYPRTAKQIAGELHALLRAARIAGPYVLVAHSLGGKYVRLFALEHPGEVAGMVLIDARSELMDFRSSPADNEAFRQAIYSQARLLRFARIFGVARLFGADMVGTPAMNRALRTQMAFFASRQKSIDATAGEAFARTSDDVRLRAAPPLGARPLIVLASGVNMANADWAEAQRRQAALGMDNRLIVAKGSGHYIQWDRPALVIAAVREVVEKVRSRALK